MINIHLQLNFNNFISKKYNDLSIIISDFFFKIIGFNIYLLFIVLFFILVIIFLINNSVLLIPPIILIIIILIISKKKKFNNKIFKYLHFIFFLLLIIFSFISFYFTINLISNLSITYDKDFYSIGDDVNLIIEPKRVFIEEITSIKLNDDLDLLVINNISNTKEPFLISIPSKYINTTNPLPSITIDYKIDYLIKRTKSEIFYLNFKSS